ncbi:ABC-three component system middle component 7 [Bacillus siamensis]|uniref:ABC-three component system middle component 7 n=1 Tax=Bacillus siamensis TaxID=659243 RepID=UPI00399C890A
MIVPSKIITLEESILMKSKFILESEIKDINQLFEENKHSFQDPSEFLITLDFLFAINKINVDYEKRIINVI